MSLDRAAVYDLFAEYGGLLDESEIRRLARALRRRMPVQCRLARESRPRPAGGADLLRQPGHARRPHLALREANKYNIHTDRHLIGLPRLIPGDSEGLAVEAPFAVYQTDQEGETRLFAAGLYRDRLEPAGHGLKIRDKLVLLDTFAIPTLLATPL